MRQITCLERDDPFVEETAATPFGEGESLPKVIKISAFSFLFASLMSPFVLTEELLSFRTMLS